MIEWQPREREMPVRSRFQAAGQDLRLLRRRIRRKTKTKTRKKTRRETRTKTKRTIKTMRRRRRKRRTKTKRRERTKRKRRSQKTRTRRKKIRQRTRRRTKRRKRTKSVGGVTAVCHILRQSGRKRLEKRRKRTRTGTASVSARQSAAGGRARGAGGTPLPPAATRCLPAAAKAGPQGAALDCTEAAADLVAGVEGRRRARRAHPHSRAGVAHGVAVTVIRARPHAEEKSEEKRIQAAQPVVDPAREIELVVEVEQIGEAIAKAVHPSGVGSLLRLHRPVLAARAQAKSGRQGGLRCRNDARGLHHGLWSTRTGTRPPSQRPPKLTLQRGNSRRSCP
mmetsp:Transcript_108992/g.303871  ORF Transcript_108992/g.303871 Transcript_108992/m.303871 type:complete len:337 (+) Transcript_108992:747-1757(+)